MLTQRDKESILEGFPNIKLSYENVIYKKVSTSDYMVAVPKGTKCFAYFTMYQNKPTCFIMELTNNKRIIDIKMFHACFSHELAYGTILYGTLFYTSGNRFFTIEDIFLNKGVEIERASWIEKMMSLKHILKKDLKQLSYNNSFVVFGLPIICKSFEELDKKINALQYPIQNIQFHLLDKVNNFLCIDYEVYCKSPEPQEVSVSILEPLSKEPAKPIEKKPIEKKPIEKKPIEKKPTKEQIFIVKPDIQDDIYHLFALHDNSEEKCGIAHIPDFTTSVMMNKLFRIIKENDNLDALEESDDEEEFENENADKFVKLDTSKKMVCQYNYKFKRWMPLRIAPDNACAISLDEFKNLNKIYEQNKRRY